MGSKTITVLASSTSTANKASAPRKRKAHNKSRLGCANCKIRRVKCDEAKPECKACTAFGLACNYSPNSPSSTSASASGPGELVLSFNRNGAFVMDYSSSPRKSPVSVDKTMLGMINSALEGSPSAARFRGLKKPSVSGSSARSQQQRHMERDVCGYSFKQADLDALHRFSHRSVLTFGTESAREVLQRETPRLACLHPFLMHFVLTFTLMHDRLLQSPSSTNFTQREAFHYYTGTAQFNKLLQAKAYSTTLTPSERDACWIASTLLGLIYIAHMDASTPEEAWPLQSPGPGEPDWLALNLGKHDMWEICDPLRDDSCFRTMLVMKSQWEDAEVDEATKFTPVELKEGGFPNLRGDILELLGLQQRMEVNDEEKEQEEEDDDDDGKLARTLNPYYRAANVLSQLMPLDYNSQNILKFTAFTHYTTPAFRALWGLKDAGALVLVLYWYTKAIPSPFWWLRKRAVLECQAMCIYLERYHSDVPHMEDILKLPKISCGLLAAA